MSELGIRPCRGKEWGHLKDTVVQMCWAETGQQKYPGGFPGSMPVSFSRRFMGMVANTDYLLFEKSDGMRYMMLIRDREVYLIDRRFGLYPIPNLVCPIPESPDAPPGTLHYDTLLDGELVRDQVTKKYNYLIYDGVAINGDTQLAKESLRTRLQIIDEWIIQPRAQLDIPNETIGMKLKDPYEKWEIKTLFARISKTQNGEYMYRNPERTDGELCSGNDGVIFTPVGLPYEPKFCQQLLKWKYPSHNTVDFRLELEVDNKREIKCFLGIKGDGQGSKRYRQVFFPRNLREKFHREDMHGKIIECTYDTRCGEWRYLRTREDKDSPNYYVTVVDTLETIAENVRTEELVDHISKSRRPPDHAKLDLSHLRPQPTKKRSRDQSEGDGGGKRYRQDSYHGGMGSPSLDPQYGNNQYGSPSRGRPSFDADSRHGPGYAPASPTRGFGASNPNQPEGYGSPRFGSPGDPPASQSAPPAQSAGFSSKEPDLWGDDNPEYMRTRWPSRIAPLRP